MKTDLQALGKASQCHSRSSGFKGTAICAVTLRCVLYTAPFLSIFTRRVTVGSYKWGSWSYHNDACAISTQNDPITIMFYMYILRKLNTVVTHSGTHTLFSIKSTLKLTKITWIYCREGDKPNTVSKYSVHKSWGLTRNLTLDFLLTHITARDRASVLWREKSHGALLDCSAKRHIPFLPSHITSKNRTFLFLYLVQWLLK